ncbi:protein FAR1-RELATED SEQUENCE 1-like [Spinacia oleracea]|uniref:Protein FAR1-RELATED SEQUENCE n=1 Tax=Spinacia oleracea TaxID=3562 RepID=A0ABM3R3S7_SPIOL|nr:protein FAR1-RELATED SEQUENCE 1-like [Spinacia oleracea]
MSSSQRSESMNAYFDGYVHSKTSLKSFVEQYEMALGDKIEKEIFADAQCMNADIQYLAIEDSLVFEYKVTERNDIGGGKVIMKDYKVLFDSSTMEVNCICRLFDWKGFLCRHAFKVLFKRNLTLVHERYILRRWRKDVEREHSNIKLLGIGGKWTSEMERSKRIESKFYSIIDNVIDSIQKCHYVENVIENISKDLLDGTWIKYLSGEIVDNQDTPNVDKDVLNSLLASPSSNEEGGFRAEPPVTLGRKSMKKRAKKNNSTLHNTPTHEKGQKSARKGELGKGNSDMIPSREIAVVDGNWYESELSASDWKSSDETVVVLSEEEWAS